MSHALRLSALLLALPALLAAGTCGAPDEPADDDLGYECEVSFPALPAPPPVARSNYALTTSNGFVSATWAVDLHGVPVRFADGTSGTFDPHHRLITLTDHIMARPDASSWTRDRLYDAYLGVRIDGVGTWLGEVPELEAAYVPGTGLIRSLATVGGVDVETFVFAPSHGGQQALVVLGRATNRGSTPRDVDLYGLVNAHAGGEGAAGGEVVSSTSAGGILESRGADHLYHRSLGTAVHRAAAPAGSADNPWILLSQGRDLTDQLVSGDDVAAGLQWDLATLSPGQSAWGGMVVGLAAKDEPAASLNARIDAFAADRGAQAVLEAEQAFWEDFHASETVPAGASDDELAVLRQSTAVLKMAQVLGSSPGHGQILASLPPGGWNMSWPRDAAYAILGLVETGHLTEARDALQFMVDGEAGTYASLLGLSDYLISACRYYGDGTEESDGATCPDGTDAGPNVELDDFGLFLLAWESYVAASRDVAFKSATLPAVIAGVGEPLLALIEADTGLLVPDSSIWERHWNPCFPNGRKRFTYSDVMAVAGLRALGRATGDPRWDEGADRIRTGLLTQGTGPVFEISADGVACPALASAPEEICPWCGPWDASVIEAIAQDVIRPESALARGTAWGILTHLRMDVGPGLRRSDDGTGSSNPSPWYDDQEWVVVDLRAVVALTRMGRALGDPTLIGDAEALLAWTTAQARANADLLPELLSDGVYTPEDDGDHVNLGADGGGEHQGSVPMAGFGPGAYILALDALRGE